MLTVWPAQNQPALPRTLHWRQPHRGPQHPLVIAGGPCAFNPEPLADFFDCFAVGDGEEVAVELAEAVARGDAGTVERHLAALAARTPGLVPLYRILADRHEQQEEVGAGGGVV